MKQKCKKNQIKFQQFEIKKAQQAKIKGGTDVIGVEDVIDL